MDHGTSSQWKEWDIVCDTFSTKLALSPGKAHYQIGAVGRQVGIVRTAFCALFNMTSNQWSKQEDLSIICASNNVTPLCNSNLSHSSAITDRNDLIERIVQTLPPDASGAKVDDTDQWSRLEMIFGTRAMLLKIDSQMLRKLAMSKNLRSGVLANYEYAFGLKVYVWLPLLGKWNGVSFSAS